MSVINKMLRDLDQRQAASAAAPIQPGKQPLHGTVRLAAGAASAASSGSPLLWAGLALLLALLGGAGWWWWHAPAAGAVPSAVVPVVVPMHGGSAAAQTTTQGPIATAPEVAVLPAPASAMQGAKAALPAPAATRIAGTGANSPTQPQPTAKATAPATIAVPTAVPLTTPSAAWAASSPVRTAPSAVGVAAGPVAGPATHNAEPLSNTARQQQAGREALAQAQALWAAGSHDAATDLLQQALGLAERSGGVSSAASVQLVSALARELGRMWLADGRVAAALELLTRLEPVLGRDADTWAMRGNAAQRLGRHPDSVRAYAAALQLRPHEPRWLLGSAVSLAAMGQTAQASEMADRARALGPVSKEVQAYLRQAGVPLTEP